jgi:carbon storage regulator
MEGIAMLVLSRKANQRIIINKNIELIVVAVNGDRVRLGFNAPNDVPIHREEVHRRIKLESHGGDLDMAEVLPRAEMVLADLKHAGTRQPEHSSPADGKKEGAIQSGPGSSGGKQPSR